ncbi:PQQ-binding-like beta-propeller repeat protein [Paenibacillus sp. OV219]|uniref:outer membrane protein assembly factor BamB family protein n=1 Tax=Paenibacillus sp. OV219 TaxID=1884377 RepID=UPI0008BE5938|nr:PQQ-binding-like beta-propeller repeat protein [Paenibacillus sp. OV219]SEP13004.1 Outer membrane protein assembly factor BamB, contains PQQ-like beta-propeller repeat [Paenibacillus sp. OV219]
MKGYYSKPVSRLRRVIIRCLTYLLIWLVAMNTVGLSSYKIAQAANEGPLFTQGAGYEQGAYDLHAVQPTSFNWTRQSRFSGPETPTIKWSFDSGGWIDSSPAIGADDTIYFGSTSGAFFAVSPNGELKWKYDFTSDVEIRTSPVIAADGTIYVGVMHVGPGQPNLFCTSGSCTNGLLAALSPQGTLKWSLPIPEVITTTSPVIGKDGTIYIGSGSYIDPGKLYAVSPDGQIKWSSYLANQEDGFASAPVIFADGTIFAQDEFINQAGERLGNMTWSWPTFSSPVIAPNGTSYFGDYGSELTAFRTGTGYVRPQWMILLVDSPTGPHRISASPALGSNGVLYIGHEDGSLYSVNPVDVPTASPIAMTDSDGNYMFNAYYFGALPKSKVNWSVPTSAWSNSPIIGNDGIIYMGNNDGQLVAVNPDGTQKWSIQAGDHIYNQSIGRNHRIYVASGNVLYAIGDKSENPPEVKPSPVPVEPGRPNAIKPKGKIIGTAFDGISQLVLKDNGNVFRMLPSGLEQVKEWANTAALMTDDYRITTDGQLMLGNELILSDVVTFSHGYQTYAALTKDGSVWVWGLNMLESWPIPIDVQSPIKVPTINKAVGVAARNTEVAILLDDGSVWSYPGEESNGYVELATGIILPNPDLKLKSSLGVTAIYGGAFNIAAQKKDGTIVYWGEYLDDIPRNRANFGLVRILRGITNVNDIKIGWGSMLLLKEGTLYTFGRSSNGQLGIATTKPQMTAVPIKGLPAGQIVTIATDFFRSAAIGRDGSIWQWGNNLFSTGAESMTPIKVTSKTGVTFYINDKIDWNAMRFYNPVQWNGSYYVPLSSMYLKYVTASDLSAGLSGFLNPLGIKTTFDNKYTVTAKKGSTTVVFNLKSLQNNTIKINNKVVNDKLVIINEKYCVPITILKQAFGMKVAADAAHHIVRINTK